MKKRDINVIFILVMAVIVFAVLVIIFFPKPPNPPVPTITPSVTPSPTLTATTSPTYTPVISITITSSPSPITATVEPTITILPTSVLVQVHTGYESGYLNFRYGPGLEHVPQWRENKQGAFIENTKFIFLSCEYNPYPWMKVISPNNLTGYVYSKFVLPDYCNTNENK